MRNHEQSLLSSLNFSTLAHTDIQTNLNPQKSNNNYQPQKEYLHTLLLDLDGIKQNSHYHPEIDTLYHSLQVFQLATHETNDPILLATALFHDIGKAISINNHAEIGADLLRGILIEPIPWLIEHHLDLLVHPKRTRTKFKNRTELKQLEMLRRWDIQGRHPHIEVIEPYLAIELITQTDEIFQLA